MKEKAEEMPAKVRCSGSSQPVGRWTFGNIEAVILLRESDLAFTNYCE